MATTPEYARRWKRLHPDRVREGTRRQRERNPLAARARNVLGWAVRVGRVTPPERCEFCGTAPGLNARGQRLIEGHHVNYAKPLEVIWLCRGCHAQIHMGLEAEAA